MSASTLQADSPAAPVQAAQGDTIVRGIHLASAGLVVADLAAWQMQCITTSAMATDMLAMGAFLALFRALRKTSPRQRAG